MEIKIGMERYAMLAKRDVRRNNSWAEFLSHSLLTIVKDTVSTGIVAYACSSLYASACTATHLFST